MGDASWEMSMIHSQKCKCKCSASNASITHSLTWIPVFLSIKEMQRKRWLFAAFPPDAWRSSSLFFHSQIQHTRSPLSAPVRNILAPCTMKISLSSPNLPPFHLFPSPSTTRMPHCNQSAPRKNMRRFDAKGSLWEVGCHGHGNPSMSQGCDFVWWWHEKKMQMHESQKERLVVIASLVVALVGGGGLVGVCGMGGMAKELEIWWRQRCH